MKQIALKVSPYHIIGLMDGSDYFGCINLANTKGQIGLYHGGVPCPFNNL